MLGITACRRAHSTPALLAPLPHRPTRIARAGGRSRGVVISCRSIVVVAAAVGIAVPIGVVLQRLFIVQGRTGRGEAGGDLLFTAAAAEAETEPSRPRCGSRSWTVGFGESVGLGVLQAHALNVFVNLGELE